MMKRVVLSVLVACLLAVSSAGIALGHAELEESDPADGATIKTPYTLSATFSEEFDASPQRSFIRVQNAAAPLWSAVSRIRTIRR